MSTDTRFTFEMWICCVIAASIHSNNVVVFDTGSTSAISGIVVTSLFSKSGAELAICGNKIRNSQEAQNYSQVQS